MIDTLGRTIEKHDIVTYPVRSGSSMWVNSGTVLEVERDHILVAKYNGVDDNLRAVKITAGDRVTIAVRGHMLRDLCDIGDNTMGLGNVNTLDTSGVCTI